MKNTKYKAMIAAVGFYLILALVVSGQAQTQTQDEKFKVADKLLAEGISLLEQGTTESYQTALEKFQTASRLFREIREKRGESLSLFFVGIASNKLGDKNTALKFFEQALLIFRALADKGSEATTLNLIGLIHYDLGEKKKALDYFNLALSLWGIVRDKGGEATTLYNIGKIYDDIGDFLKALEYYDVALLIFNDLGDKQREAKTLSNIGLIYFQLHKGQKALEYFSLALPIWRSVSNRGEEAATLTIMGRVYADLGDNQKALEFNNLALFLWRELGDKRLEGTTLHNLGMVYANLGDYQKALEFYNLALPLRRGAGINSEVAQTLTGIGVVYSNLGEKQKALNQHNLALELFRMDEDKRGESVTLNNIGKVYRDLGEKQKALEFFNLALGIQKNTNDRQIESNTLINIGTIYFDLGENQKAAEFFVLALSSSRIVSDKRIEAQALNNLGGLYQVIKNLQEALNFYNLALPIFREISDKVGEVQILNNIGKVHDDLGEKQKALEFFNEALSLARQIGDKSFEGAILNNIGVVYFVLKESEKALKVLNQALILFKTIRDKNGEATTLTNLMSIWDALGNGQAGIFYGKQAVNIYQQLRQDVQILDKEIQQIYLKTFEDSYRTLTHTLIKQNRLPEAHKVLNLFKDQQFFDFNQSQIKKPLSLVLTPREAILSASYEKTSERVGLIGSEFEELKRKIGNRQSSAEEKTQMQKLESDLKIASDEFFTILKQAEIEFSKPPNEKDKVNDDETDLPAIKTALRQLNQQTEQKAVAVYQLVDAENFSALVISEGGIEKVSVPFNGTELNEKAQRLWALLQTDKYDTTKLSKEIYDVVFASLEAKLPKDTTTIMWSLDGNLRYVPMAALWDGKQFLAERYNHAVFTRADAEKMTANVKPIWTGTGFGSSQAATVNVLGIPNSFDALPGVTEELGAIFKKGVVQGATFPDKQFSKANFLAELKKKRPLVHIASHFSFRPGDEARSFLLLGDGTAFTLEEMRRENNLFEGVELLTLSACNTAAQQAGANGREVDGFAELAQRLGANSVMATLWSVADCTTPWLMREFYNSKLNKNKNKAESLREAQIGLISGKSEIKSCPTRTDLSPIKIVLVEKESDRKADTTRSGIYYVNKKDAPLWDKDKHPPFAHPFYWSPFILIGNWL